MSLLPQPLLAGASTGGQGRRRLVKKPEMRDEEERPKEEVKVPLYRPTPRMRGNDVWDYIPIVGDKLRGKEHYLLLGAEIVALTICIFLMYVCYFHFDLFHYHVSKAYAHMGHAHAQHLVGQRLLQGKGIPQDHSEAMKWFKMAARQGHAHASYNLAIGHLNGYEAGLQPGEAHDLIRHAAVNGVEMADDVYENACKMGMCED